MAEVTLVYWRDIPGQVIVRAGRKRASAKLDERFEKAIDQAAMNAGLAGTDDYLSAWRRIAGEPCGDDLDAEAARLAAEIDAAYPMDRLRRLIAQGGLESAGEETA